MRNPLQTVLDFAVARSGEAEALFKTWASEVVGAEAQALLAELAATERGRTEMLSRMSPEELTGTADETVEVAELLVNVRAPRRVTLGVAIDLAIRRKDVTAALYERVAELGGEACSFFRAMADEDRRAARALGAIAERLDEKGKTASGR